MNDSHSSVRLARTLLYVVRYVMVSIWLGGLVLLGTNVAPLIFRNVPAPTSADAMTLVFMRFDRFAVASGIMLLAVEIASALNARAALQAPNLLGTWRVLLASAALVSRLIEAAWLAPAIASLHRNGAVRGLGTLGETLARLHGWAEASGKIEVGLLLAYIGIVAWSESCPIPGSVPASAGPIGTK